MSSEKEIAKIDLVEGILTTKDRKQKAYIRFIQNHGIDNIESLELTRLNCEIPKQLHTWLNVYARSDNGYTSMTEITIEVLGKFAKKRGFKIKSNG